MNYWNVNNKNLIFERLGLTVIIIISGLVYYI